MKRVTLFSAGGGSWLTAMAVQEAYPADEHILLFTDTLYEDADAYRFLIDGALRVFDRRLVSRLRCEDFPDYRVDDALPLADYAGNPEWRKYLADLHSLASDAVPELVWLIEGRDPWEVFRDERLLGNSRLDPCSKVLKRNVLTKWAVEHCDPASTVFYIGIDWTEAHRFDDGAGGGIRPRRAAMGGWRYEALLTLRPYASKPDALAAMRAVHLAPPRLYAAGYAHNNCGGFCIKAGHAHYANRLRVHPDRFAYDAMMERKCMEFLNSPHSMMSDRAGGNGKRALTLAAFRERVEAAPQQALMFDDWGGCGCMVDA